MFNLSGKTALITGASGGIGSAISEGLHGSGGNVILSGTNEKKLDALAERLGKQAFTLPSDLRDNSSIKSLISNATDLTGGVDILVHCAGITRDNIALRMKDEEWNDVIELNLTAGFRLARASLRGMMKKRWGRIIFITSVVGTTGNPGQTNYAASKAGLTGVAKALAAEVAGRAITVNCIAPGFIETEMTNALNDDQRETIRVMIPAGRFGAADDIASGCVYLASEEAAYITGQTIHINGGMSMV